jgi:hypothetical protein
VDFGGWGVSFFGAYEDYRFGGIKKSGQAFMHLATSMTPPTASVTVTAVLISAIFNNPISSLYCFGTTRCPLTVYCVGRVAHRVS